MKNEAYEKRGNRNKKNLDTWAHKALGSMSTLGELEKQFSRLGTGKYSTHHRADAFTHAIFIWYKYQLNKHEVDEIIK